MTKAEFLALGPQERNAAVEEAAGRVFRWWSIHPVEMWPTGELGVDWKHTFSSAAAVRGCLIYPVEVLLPNPDGDMPFFLDGGGNPPRDFSSIASAWELVEEMKADGFDGYCVAEGEVYFSKGDAHNEHVLSLFGASSPPVEDWSAATTALHISIAYLKAKGAIQ